MITLCSLNFLKFPRKFLLNLDRFCLNLYTLFSLLSFFNCVMELLLFLNRRILTYGKMMMTGIFVRILYGVFISKFKFCISSELVVTCSLGCQFFVHLGLLYTCSVLYILDVVCETEQLHVVQDASSLSYGILYILSCCSSSLFGTLVCFIYYSWDLELDSSLL